MRSPTPNLRTLLQSHAHIEAGKLRALAVTTTARSSAAPRLPTMIEAGVPGYAVAGWYGVLASAGTPPAIVAKLNRQLVHILNLPDVRKSLAADGSEPIGSAPGAFAAHIRAEIAMWHDVVVEAGIKPE